MSRRPKSKTITMETAILVSEAFRCLNGSAKYIYFVFLMKRQMSEVPRKSGNWICINCKELVFTYEQAQKDHDYSATKFKRAIDILIEFGFIDIEHYGGQSKGNYTLYGLSERWKRYGKPDFINKERGMLKFKPGLRGYTDNKKNPCIQKRKAERALLHT